MLEAPFDVGRRLVLDALVDNRKTQIPVAAPLRLFSPWLWDVGGAETLPPRRLPRLVTEDRASLAGSGRLLQHPAFATWTVRGEAVLQAGEEALHQPGWDLEVRAKLLAAEIFAEPLAVVVLSRRLEAMSEWLLLASEEAQAGWPWSRLNRSPGARLGRLIPSAVAGPGPPCLQWAMSSSEKIELKKLGVGE